MEQYGVDTTENRMKNDYEDYLYLESLKEPYIPDKNLQKAIHTALRLNTNENRASALNALVYKVEHQELGSPLLTKRREQILNKLYNTRDTLYAKVYRNNNINYNTEGSMQTGDPSNTESIPSGKRRSRRVQKNKKNRKTRRH